MKSHVVPEMDVHVPETHAFGEAAPVSIVAPASVESDLGRGTAENVSVPSQELPVDAEPKEPVTHEGATPEVHVPITTETEPEPHSRNSISEDKVSTLEAGEYVLPSPESHEAAYIELSDGIISPAAGEPRPDVVAPVVTPVLGTSELQAQHSVEETMEVSFAHIPSAVSLTDCNKIIKEVHIVEAASETEIIVPNEGRLRLAMKVLPTNPQLESTVEPVKAHLDIQEAGASDSTKVEPQTIPEKSSAQIEADGPALATLQVRQLISSSYLLTIKP